MLPKIQGSQKALQNGKHYFRVLTSKGDVVKRDIWN